MNDVKIGVIGTGHLGNLHTKLFKQVSNCSISGIYDVDIEKAKQVAADHDVKYFENLDLLFDASDAVSIVASTSAHYELAKRALEKA